MKYIAVVLLFLVAAGPASATELVVATASNLNGVCQELAREFEKASGIHVVYNFASTGNLARQIENGAPFDVFLAADVQHVDGLERSGWVIPGTRAIYARGRLVLWTHANIKSINDLAQPWVRFIALAQPDSAPYGAAAVEALHKLGIWDQVKPKLVYAENIGMAKQYAASGNADAAFTAYSLVMKDGGKALPVDQRLYSPIDQALGIVTGSKHVDAARRYVKFVLSPPSAAILVSHGYLAPAR